MLCAISGEAPQAPVASRKSGNVFEKRLIEAHIAEHHTDPVTGEDLELDDLIELKTSRIQPPRPPALTSIPALLSAFQNEWDAIALQTYELQKELSHTRQELSTALYQHDSASRAIARLTQERDEAREALSRITISGAANGDAMEVDGQQLPEALAAKVEETHATLSSTRRKRKVPEDWATGETIEAFNPVNTTEPLYPGSQTLALDASGELVIVGGTDGVAGVFSISQNKVVQVLKAGAPITAATWWGSKAVVATSTGQVKVFEDGIETADLGSHAGPVTSLSLHPSTEILASTGSDKSYRLYDLAARRAVAQVYFGSELLCGEFHPDGHLFGVGTRSGQILVAQTNTGDVAATLTGESAVKALSFSENGYLLAAATKGSSSVDIWDLRKEAILASPDTGGPVDAVKWDYSGQFLATGGPGSVSVQQWSKSSKSFSEPLRKAVSATAVAWGAEAKSLLTLTSEGALSIFESA